MLQRATKNITKKRAKRIHFLSINKVSITVVETCKKNTIRFRIKNTTKQHTEQSKEYERAKQVKFLKNRKKYHWIQNKKVQHNPIITCKTSERVVADGRSEGSY